jgi:two-component system, LuxR family, sensor kinase FixL
MSVSFTSERSPTPSDHRLSASPANLRPGGAQEGDLHSRPLLRIDLPATAARSSGDAGAQQAALDQSMREMVHELSQPLAAAANFLRASVSLAHQPQDESETLLSCLKKAALQIERSMQLLQRLASQAGSAPQHVALVSLNRIIESAVALSLPPDCQAGARAIVMPTLVLDESLPAVAVDRVQIEQVLLNLLRNAQEALSHVPPTRAALLERAKLTVRTYRRGNFQHVEVSDTGEGISQENLRRVFTPLFTTKPSGQGLGLAISRSLIERHGGELSVASMLGLGTTFSFTLPLTQP